MQNRENYNVTKQLHMGTENTPILVKLVNTGKLTNNHLIRLLVNIKNSDVIGEVAIRKINWRLLDEKQKRKIRKSVPFLNQMDTVLFETLLAQGFTKLEITQFVAGDRPYGINPERLFEALLPDSSFAEMVQYAAEIDRHDFWTAIAHWPGFKADLSDCSIEPLASIWNNMQKDTKPLEVNMESIATGKCNFAEILEYYNQHLSLSEDIFKAITRGIPNMNFTGAAAIDFYLKLREKTKIEQGSNIQDLCIALLQKRVIDEDEMFKIAFASNSWTVWMKVFKLSTKTCTELTDFATSQNKEIFWWSLIQSGKMEANDAYDLALKLDDSSSYQYLIENHHLSLAQCRVLLQKENVRKYELGAKIPWIEIDFNECLALCKQISNSFAEFVIKQKQLSVEELMKLGFLLNKEYTWGLVYEKLSVEQV